MKLQLSKLQSYGVDLPILSVLAIESLSGTSWTPHFQFGHNPTGIFVFWLINYWTLFLFFSKCSLKVFIVAGIIGITILLPINFLGNQLSYDFSDLPNKSLDSFSISNVDDGSNR